MTGLSFGSLGGFDPLGHSEGVGGVIEIDQFDQIVL